MEDLKDKAALINKRDDLTARIDSINKDFRRGLDRDLSEQAIQLENAEVLQEILRVSTDELARVKAQLIRLAGEGQS